MALGSLASLRVDVSLDNPPDIAFVFPLVLPPGGHGCCCCKRRSCGKKTSSVHVYCSHLAGLAFEWRAGNGT